MEAIVLAGGFGTRLRKVVSDVPKPMSPISGRPFLDFLLESLASKGFHRVVISAGYMADKIVSHFGNEIYGLELVYEIEKKPLGTGGAVRQAVSRCIDNHVYVFNGDTLVDLDVHKTESLWNEYHCPIIVVRFVDDTSRYGRVELNDGIILSFTEKGVKGPGLINAGVYVLPTNSFSHFDLDAPFSLEADYLADLIEIKPVNGCITDGYFIDIGIPEDYARAQNDLSGKSC